MVLRWSKTVHSKNSCTDIPAADREYDVEAINREFAVVLTGSRGQIFGGSAKLTLTGRNSAARLGVELIDNSAHEPPLMHGCTEHFDGHRL